MMINDLVKEIPVCYKAFMAVHGVKAKRIQNIQKSLKLTGKAPTDGRGKYDHKSIKTPENARQSVIDHITSFQGRRAHYSLSKTKKIYLPESLNIKKCTHFIQNLEVMNRLSLMNITEGFSNPISIYHSDTQEAILVRLVTSTRLKLKFLINS